MVIVRAARGIVIPEGTTHSAPDAVLVCLCRKPMRMAVMVWTLMSSRLPSVRSLARGRVTSRYGRGIGVVARVTWGN